MKGQSGGLRALSVVLMTLLPIGIAFAAYLLLYVDAKRAYLTQRNFRTLGTMTRQLSEHLSAVKVAAESAAGECGDRRECLVDRLQEVPNIEIEQVVAKPTPARPGGKRRKDSEATPGPARLRWEVEPGAAGASLTLEYESLKSPVKATVKLSRIMDKQIATAVFDDFVLTDVNGRILYHQKEFDTGNVPDLQTLVNGATGLNAHPQEIEGRTTPSLTPRAGSTASPTPAGAKSAAGTATTISFKVPLEATYLGEKYLLFFQSVPVPFSLQGERSGTTQLLLCGLVKAGELDASALEVSPTLLSILAFLLLLGLLAWQLLKLSYLGRRERLDAWDVYLLTLSSIAATGLITVALLDGYAYRALSNTLNQEMETLSDDIEQHFRTELGQAYEVLDLLRSEIANSGPRPVELDEKVVKRVRYPYFTDLVWFSGEGAAKARWTPEFGAEGALSTLKKIKTTQPLLANNRDYFTDAQRHRLWAMPREEDGVVMRFAPQVVQSKVTGEFTVALAAPIETGANPTQLDVAVVATRLLSLIDSVTPPGLEFAVINEAGRVQLHSEEGRNLQENLFQECDDNRRLRAAVRARRAAHIEAPYYGEDYHLYTRPLRDTPWSLVILRKKEMLRGTNVWICVTWLIGFSAYLLCWLAAGISMQLVRPGYRGDWLWPRGRETGSYCVATIILAAIGIFLFVVPRQAHATADLLAIVCAPLMALSVLYLLLAHVDPPLKQWRYCGAAALALLTLAAFTAGAAHPVTALLMLIAITGAVLVEPRVRCFGSRHERRFRFSYVAMLFALLLLIAVGPAVVLFNSTFAQAMVAFVRLGQRDTLGSLINRADRVAELALRLNTQTPWTQRLAEPLDRYYLRLFHDPDRPRRLTTPIDRLECAFQSGRECPGTCVPHTAAHPSLATADIWHRPIAWLEGVLRRQLEQAPLQEPYLAQYLARRAPTLKTTVARIGQMVHPEASDAAWRWENGPNRRMKLAVSESWLKVPIGTGAGLSDLTARVPQVPICHGPQWWLAAIVILFVWPTALFAAVWSIVKRLFLLDADRLDKSTSNGPAGGTTWLFIHPARQAPTNLVPHIVDLRELSEPIECERLLFTHDVLAARVLILDHFDSRLDQADWSAAKLKLVEALASRRDTAVILLCDVDPLAYWRALSLDAPKEGSGSAAGAASALARWGEVLATFDGVCVPHTAGDEAGATMLLGSELRELLKQHGATHAAAGCTDAQFQTLWAGLTKPEKLVLIQLANEGFANPKNDDVVRGLMRRGLIVRKPALSLPSKQLRQLVRRAESPETVAEWESEGGWSGWARLRPALFGVLMVGVGFLYIAQRGLFDSTLAMAGAITGALPILLRLLGTVGQERSSGTPRN